MSTVNIKLADQGWILESLAHDISDLSDEVGHGLQDDNDSQIQYYFNYSCWNGRRRPIEIGYFTHIEEDPISRLHFFRVAENMDHCVCHAQRYADELTNYGIKNVRLIAPGIDLDHFSPKIKIGVVGRAYDTGRKGEHLVREVMDVKGIEWSFTGEGWPGQALNLPYDKMPDFYNSMDYILVPSLYEGGPMCVVEGLACGKEIIASDVGWVKEFPHIPFERGDAASLRLVLEGLVAKRRNLRRAVEGHSKHAWATQHLDLFEELLQKKLPRRTLGEYKAATAARTSSARPFGAELVLHGIEAQVGGGPSVRVPKTVEKMNKIGLPATLGWNCRSRASLSHIFNLFTFESCAEAIALARRKGNDVALSPIFLNMNDAQFYTFLVPELFEGLAGSELDRPMSELKQHLEENENLPVLEPYPDYHKQVCELVQKADLAILLSDYEKRCLEHLGALGDMPHHIVRNPVEIGGFASGNAALVTDLLGTDRYFLQIGRIEVRKNQLLLAECARRLGVKAVFVGQCAQPEYTELVKTVAGDRSVFLGRIGHDNPLFGALIQNSAAVCLPSWSEGAPMSALEAASCGANMILSSRSSEREYFGDHATYVNPADINGMMMAMEAAMARGRGRKNNALIEFVRDRFSYERHVNDTVEAYSKLTDLPSQFQMTG